VPRALEGPTRRLYRNQVDSKMNETTYLFIDGQYLQTVYRDLFFPLFGQSYKINYEFMLKNLGAKRAFYYDCLDEDRKTGESDEDLRTRVQAQKDLFNRIRKVPGMHVQPGWLKPANKDRQRTQKEVDVQLAVDMLTHSFYKNMTKAILLSGDRDFRPVVESVVRLGTYVTLACNARTASKELADEADEIVEIGLDRLCSWIELEKYARFVDHFPHEGGTFGNEEDPLQRTGQTRQLLREGIIGPNKHPIRLYEIDQLIFASIRVNERDYLLIHFADAGKLVEYLEKRFGDIVWK
jgi:uncharacterized LabA/DUF88 family protein